MNLPQNKTPSSQVRKEVARSRHNDQRRVDRKAAAMKPTQENALPRQRNQQRQLRNLDLSVKMSLLRNPQTKVICTKLRRPFDCPASGQLLLVYHTHDDLKHAAHEFC